MAVYIGIDIGSTSISAAAIDTGTSRLLRVCSAANIAETTSDDDRSLNRSEWDISKINQIALGVLTELVSQIGGETVDGIGVTGQQQGCQLYETATLDPIGPFIGWQDQRAKDSVRKGQDDSYLDYMAELGSDHLGPGEPQGFAASGCPLVTGYTASTLTWLKSNKQLPKRVGASTAPEFFVSRLTGSKPVTDPTDAAGWGVFDVANSEWNRPLIDALGLPATLFPDVVESCTVAGTLQSAIADRIGLDRGLPVAVASGDHQSAFAGTVANYDDTVAINIGTGGQATIYVPGVRGLKKRKGAIDHGDLELRPYISTGFLLAGVGIVGGRSFRVFRDFFSKVGSQVFDADQDDENLYDRLVELAADSEPGASGVEFSPFFTGTRMNRSQRGQITGLDPVNFTPGNLARALLEGMARQLHASYETALKTGASPRNTLTGSGNGLRQNHVLRQAIEVEFGMKMKMSANEDEAATGAALCAAVACGEFETIAEASQSFVKYGN